MLISITIISNITVLVSNNVICSGCFIPMSHSVNKKARQLSLLPPLPFNRFLPDLLVDLQGILYQSFFALIRLSQKNKFSKQNNLFFNLLLVGWLVLFHSSVIMKLRTALHLHICIASYLVSQEIMWHN